MGRSIKLVDWWIGIGLLFPLFFQLSGGIYKDFWTDSGGNIATLPLPIAVLACFSGLALLYKQFCRAYIAATFVASFVFVLFLSVVFASPESRVEFRKLILLAQFIMPAFALILGQMVNDEDKIIAKAFLTVLLVIVPFQLAAGWMQGTLTLTHSLYIFSIYQHFQFVPVVFVCAYSYAAFALCGTHRMWLVILLPFMCIYALESLSFLTIAASIIFAAVFVWRKLGADKKSSGARASAILLVVIAIAIAGIGAYAAIANRNSNMIGDPGQYFGKLHSIAEGKLPSNVSERLADWKLFGTGIIESPRTMAFGHVEPLAREVRTSAHNWYIDIAYSFGLVSLLPVLLLIGYTTYLFRRSRNALPLETLGLCLVVFYLVVVDSNFKVTLRQPYPGIFACFMWGLLLSRLHPLTAARPNA
jgi:hypothetical protein